MNLKIAREIKAERVSQDHKWGEQNHDDLRWFAIFSEEAGEVAKEVVEAEFTRSMNRRIDHERALREELVQTAAVAVAWLEAIDRRDA